MADCNHDCSNCSVEDCGENVIRKEALGEMSSVKKVYGVVSGKGGVGKSLVTSLLACAANAAGKKTAILDADITGPSIPKAFGVNKQRVMANDYGIIPAASKTGIDIMSINLILDNETDPVVWRGPIIAGTIKQFWSDVIWENEDYMFVDMPPGTGDVPLTVFQSLPVDGIIIVTSPQELVGMIVEKAVNMAKMMNIPVVGIVENMSYIKCPCCSEIIRPFGESHVKKLALQFGIPNVAEMPIDPSLAALCDKGSIEDVEPNPLADFAAALMAE